jgi:RNA polymerase sigma-70 factor (ECF subfamily)
VVSDAVSSLWQQPAVQRSRVIRSVTIEQLVRDYSAFVWRSVRRLGVPEGDVDDVVQQVFLKARDRLPELSADSTKGTLYRLALGLASNHKRSLRRRREEHLEEDRDRPATSDETMRLEQRALLDRLLEPLDLDLRAVLVLHEAEELSVTEIAELLKIPPGTAASRLRRAREEVKAALARFHARNPALKGSWT